MIEILRGHSVTLQVEVGKSGAIAAIDVLEAVPPLTEEAGKVVRNWKFKPAEFNSKPIPSTFLAQFVFWQIPRQRS